MANRRNLYWLALLYAIIIGFSFLFTKLALQFANPVDTLAFRFTLSFLLLGIPVWAGWIKLDWRGRKWWRLLPIGMLYPAVFFGLQTAGLNLTTVSEAGIFQATSPIFTLLLAAPLLKERTNWIQKLSVLCSVGGVVFIMTAGGASMRHTSIAAAILMLGSSAALSSYSVLARMVRNDYTAMQMSYVMMLVGSVVFDSLAIAGHAYDGTMSRLLEPLRSPVFIGSVLYVGLMSSLLSSLLSNYLLSRMEAYKVSLFVNLSTLVSIMSGVVFLNDRLETIHVLGAVLIVGGVFGVQTKSRKKWNNQPKLEVRSG